MTVAPRPRACAFQLGTASGGGHATGSGKRGSRGGCSSRGCNEEGWTSWPVYWNQQRQQDRAPPQQMAPVPVAAAALALCYNASQLHRGLNFNAPGRATAGTTVEACGAACCAQATSCSGFTFTPHQPHADGPCAAGTPCCWIKEGAGSLVQGNCGLDKGDCTSAVVRTLPPPKPSKFWTPTLSYVKTIALDPTGNLRDPSAAVQDPKTKRWHFWVDYMPGHTQPGWHAFLHHYSAETITGPWTNHGLALNHSTNPTAWDYSGQFSSSVIFDEDDQLWYLFYSASGRNQSALSTCAQLAASATTPDGPWTVLGPVATPTGSPASNWSGGWNTRRLDSGRALVIGGRKGYWTKGVQSTNVASEGLYVPVSPHSFAPPYTEAPGNPRFQPPASDTAGYENCEFFAGPNPTRAAVLRYPLPSVCCLPQLARFLVQNLTKMYWLEQAQGSVPLVLMKVRRHTSCTSGVPGTLATAYLACRAGRPRTLSSILRRTHSEIAGSTPVR